MNEDYELESRRHLDAMEAAQRGEGLYAAGSAEKCLDFVRDNRDPGYVKWVVVTKRKDGGLPRAEKIVGWFDSEEDATKHLSNLACFIGDDARENFTVEPMIVYFSQEGGRYTVENDAENGCIVISRDGVEMLYWDQLEWEQDPALCPNIVQAVIDALHNPEVMDEKLRAMGKI